MLRRSPRPKGLDTQTEIKSPDATEDESSSSPATESPPKFWFDMEKKPRVSTRELFNGLRSRFAGKPLAPAPAPSPSPTGTPTPQRAGRGRTASQPPSQRTAAPVRNHPCSSPRIPLFRAPSPLPSTCTSGCRPDHEHWRHREVRMAGSVYYTGCDGSTGTDGMPTPESCASCPFCRFHPIRLSICCRSSQCARQLSGSSSAAVAPAIPPASH